MLESGLDSQYHHLGMMSFMTLISAILESTDRSYLTVFLSLYVVKWKELLQKRQYRDVLSLLIIITWFNGLTTLVPGMIRLFMLCEQEKISLKYSRIDKMVIWLVKFIDVEFSLPSPLIGTNSNDYVNQIITWMTDFKIDFIDHVMEIMLKGHMTEAVKIRKLGVNKIAMPFPVEQPLISGTDILSEYTKISKQMRLGVILITVAIVFKVLGIWSIVMLALILATYSMESDIVIRSFPERKGAKIADGVYRITTTHLEFFISKGIGTCYNGILHIPYHVCQATPIRIGQTVYQPYHINQEADLVTYSGPPQMAAYQLGDKVYVNKESEDYRYSYDVTETIDKSANVLTFPSLTDPGESGSPVLGYRNIDGLETELLLGLAGRYLKSPGYTTTEFSMRVELPQEKKGVIQVITHPGSGKTRKVIVQKTLELLTSGKANKVIITGPTRVVCKEIYNAIHTYTNTALLISADKSARRDYSAKVQIGSHRTVLSMIHKGDIAMQNFGALLIDEAHFDDPATRMLRKLGKHYAECEHPRIVYELSATLDGITAKESNKTITDIEIQEKDIVETIDKELHAGKKVLAFVPGKAHFLAKQLRDKFHEYDPVILSRETYESATNTINNKDWKLVISTNIAECGINLKDLDVVVDYGKSFTYVETNGIIHGEMLNNSEASTTQRRGRVGRNKEGIYYYVPRDKPLGMKRCSEFEAEILSVGRFWNTDVGEYDFMLTDRQFDVWLNDKKSLTPMEIFLLYDSMGSLLNREIVQEKFKDYSARGSVNYEGCGNAKCNCKGKYIYYDTRAHDRLFKPDN